MDRTGVLRYKEVLKTIREGCSLDMLVKIIRHQAFQSEKPHLAIAFGFKVNDSHRTLVELFEDVMGLPEHGRVIVPGTLRRTEYLTRLIMQLKLGNLEKTNPDLWERLKAAARYLELMDVGSSDFSHLTPEMVHYVCSMSVEVGILLYLGFLHHCGEWNLAMVASCLGGVVSALGRTPLEVLHQPPGEELEKSLAIAVESLEQLDLAISSHRVVNTTLGYLILKDKIVLDRKRTPLERLEQCEKLYNENANLDSGCLVQKIRNLRSLVSSHSEAETLADGRVESDLLTMVDDINGGENFGTLFYDIVSGLYRYRYWTSLGERDLVILSKDNKDETDLQMLIQGINTVSLGPPSYLAMRMGTSDTLPTDSETLYLNHDSTIKLLLQEEKPEDAEYSGQLQLVTAMGHYDPTRAPYGEGETDMDVLVGELEDKYPDHFNSAFEEAIRTGTMAVEEADEILQASVGYEPDDESEDDSLAGGKEVVP